MMTRKWFLPVSIAVLLALGVLGLAGCVEESAPSEGNGQQKGIQVSGEGKVTAVPDVVSLQLGIEAQDVTVARARAKASEAMNQVMTALTANGVARNDIKTRTFSIQRVIEYDSRVGKPIMAGYRVINTVTAKIRDVDKAGLVIDAVAEAGGDLTRFDGISLTVDNPQSFMVEAREKAMTDAKAKAKQLADLAGVTLGKPIYIAESGQQPTPLAFSEARLAAPIPTPSPTPISPGEIEVTRSVYIVYQIK